MAIHSTAIIDSSANIAEDVNIGPYTIIGPNVNISQNCNIESHCLIEKNVIIGENSYIHKSAVIGSIPQDNLYQESETKVIIGKNSTIREFSIIARGSTKDTEIGDNFALMAFASIEHDCSIGDNVLISKAATVSGNVIIGNNVIVGGLTYVNRSCHIGSFVFIGGGYRVSCDIPPYLMTGGEPITMAGINNVALKKNDYLEEDIIIIKDAYDILFDKLSTREENIKKLNDNNNSKYIEEILKFINESKKGIL